MTVSPTEMRSAAALELAMVMPVFNEAACIAPVVDSWLAALTALGIRFRIIVLNDGSTDDTVAQLAVFAGDARVTVVNKRNTGHGPTILAGYRQAAPLAEWVFQCDSDDEMRAEHFAPLWAARVDADALFGTRTGRVQNWSRALLSAASRLTVRLVFGRAVPDVNTPFRLLRAPLLAEILRQMPDDLFAPNVIISGALARAGCRLVFRPTPHAGRKTGAASIVKWRLVKAAVKAFGQTLRCRPRLARRSGDDRV
jgi:glycosyltransferase involved in cell wall biosynthesis